MLQEPHFTSSCSVQIGQFHSCAGIYGLLQTPEERGDRLERKAKRPEVPKKRPQRKRTWQLLSIGTLESSKMPRDTSFEPTTRKVAGAGRKPQERGEMQAECLILTYRPTTS